MNLQLAVPFFTSVVADVPEYTAHLTIGMNTAGTRFGRGASGGFGSWGDGEEFWTYNGIEVAMDNMQAFHTSGRIDHLLRIGGAVPHRIVVTVEGVSQTWEDATGGFTRVYGTITGPEVLTAANVGQVATVEFFMN